MTKIKLSQGKYAIVDTEDFEWLNHWKWSFSNTGYATRTVYIKGSGRKKQKNKVVLMHRLVNNTPLGLETDHLNRNKLDNRKINLRTVTKSENTMNTGLRETNTSGVKGVTFDKWTNKWKVRIRVNGKIHNLGRFTDKENASNAYQQAFTKLTNSITW